MNDITLLRDAGPEAPALTPAARSAARAALLAEIDAVRAPRRPFRLPSRRARWRIGGALVAVAASWAAAVVIAAPDGPGTPADGVVLVDADMPTFPLSLDPAPDGLRPAFDGGGDGAGIASYADAGGENGFTLYVGEDEPEGRPDVGGPGYDLWSVDEVVVDGRDGELVRYARDECTDDLGQVCSRRAYTALTWERRDDQWVTLLAHGSFRAPDRVLALAGSLVDRPQRVALAAELVPVGWSVQFFTMGRVLTLVDDSDEQQTITVHVPRPEDVPPLDGVRGSLMGPVGPQLDVTVNDRPAALVRVDNGPRDRGWFLQAQFEDGTTFTLQVPAAFTREQVLRFAEEVSYRP